MSARRRSSVRRTGNAAWAELRRTFAVSAWPFSIVVEDVGGLLSRRARWTDNGRMTPPNASPDSFAAYCVLSDSAGRVWVGTQGGGVLRLDRPGAIAGEHYGVES